jgi:hypothetical protein
MNALKTGVHAQSLVLPCENLADLEQLIDEWYQRYRPTTPEARSLVDDLICGEWLKRRLRAAETQIWAYDHKENYHPDKKNPLGQTAATRGKAFAQLQWRIECNRRAFRQALQDLNELQAAAQAVAVLAPVVDSAVESSDPASVTLTPETTSPQIGFVPETPVADPPQPVPAPSPHAPTRRIL